MDMTGHYVNPAFEYLVDKRRCSRRIKTLQASVGWMLLTTFSSGEYPCSGGGRPESGQRWVSAGGGNAWFQQFGFSRRRRSDCRTRLLIHFRRPATPISRINDEDFTVAAPVQFDAIDRAQQRAEKHCADARTVAAYKQRRNGFQVFLLT